MENPKNSRNKANSKKSKISKLVTPILAGTLFFASPDWAIAQNTSNQTRNKAEISTSTILDRLDQKLWISLPDEFKNKVLDFVLNDTIMRTRSATAYTEEFLINEMQNDRWIEKKNQLLFLRSSIYSWISKKTLYDWLDDENESRSDEYDKVLTQISKSYENYKNWFKIYMEEWINESEKKINESQKKIKEYDEQSAKAREQSAESLTSSLENLARFYNRYKKDPSTIKDDEVKQRKEVWKKVIQRCKDDKIDYKAKLSPEMLKFYGVE